MWPHRTRKPMLQKGLKSFSINADAGHPHQLPTRSTCCLITRGPQRTMIRYRCLIFPTSLW
ncbi:hypothetical protein TELCIR_16067 [Teladorsagia circumcincta]|uniref:Uncharacterized protein n=1 Tax=Teladorsagia circumcincta TaxID=45464 RepID=A0A2G9TWU8_TELCI|nr:hypothetical protein TELCIR_16067 [Teladorsagia circumcincta]